MDNTIKELIKIDLKKGMSLNNISKKYNVKKTVIRALMQEIEPKHKEVQSVVQSVVQEEVSVTTNTNTINNYLESNRDILVQIIEEYKKGNRSLNKAITVQLPFDKEPNYKISMRVNKEVMDSFREFCNENKQFTQKELISQALLEFMNKFKKN